MQQSVTSRRQMASLARRTPRAVGAALLLLGLLASAPGARAARERSGDPGQSSFAGDRMSSLDLEDLAALSLEELMRIEITSVAGVPQTWFSSPAAIYVVTGDEVRRSGHRNLAEALRMVPGMFVGQLNSHAWILSPRGFAGGLANKTLVLVDGREVYDPLSAGTFWEVQDVVLEDLDRIEVIRGPGATLWGANAVNGVINVITKSAKATQGSYAGAGAGTHEESFAALRHGGRLGENGWFRAAGKYSSRGSLHPEEAARDEWSLAHAFFRADFERADEITVTIDVDAYRSPEFGNLFQRPVPAPVPTFQPTFSDGEVGGGHLLGRAQRLRPDGQGWSVDAYYDRTHRLTNEFEVDRDTFDLELRHFFRAGDRHDFISGVAYNYTSDSTQPSFQVSLDPRARSSEVWSGFLQDTITVRPERWFVMVGSKLEHNDHTGFEVQPGVRAWFTPDDRQMWWGAASRPVRVPSRGEEDAVAILFFADPGVSTGSPTGTIVPFLLTGDRDLEAEKVVALELGYRRRLGDDLTVDFAIFDNTYEDLIFVGTAPPLRFTDEGSADTYGGEAALTWDAADHWRLRGSYGFTEVEISGPINPQDETNTPHHLAQLRSYLTLFERVELNGGLYYVDRRPTNDADSYLRLDLGVLWRPRPGLELAIWGQNLLEDTHLEASGLLEVERSGYVSVRFRF